MPAQTAPSPPYAHGDTSATTPTGVQWQPIPHTPLSLGLWAVGRSPQQQFKAVQEEEGRLGASWAHQARFRADKPFHLQSTPESSILEIRVSPESSLPGSLRGPSGVLPSLPALCPFPGPSPRAMGGGGQQAPAGPRLGGALAVGEGGSRKSQPLPLPPPPLRKVSGTGFLLCSKHRLSALEGLK